MSAWLAALPAVHFVRPQWLWALLALPLLGWWWRSRQQRASAWRGIVDPHLLPHLLEAGSDRRTHAALAVGMLAWILAVTALAGPAWRKVEQPLWQTRAPLVIALDLSSAVLANDLPPSRLLQARAKLATLLRERNGGQVALVAYAGDAFTVAPLTDDAANVALFLDVLAPDVMPVDGQSGDRAIAVSMRLLQQAGADRGDILLLTDHADPAAHAYAASAARAGYRVSALGLGRTAGAPYRDRDGRIGQARLDEASLRTLAGNGHGQYAALTTDAADLRALGVLDPQQTGDASGSNRGRAGASWQDEGYWLLPPLMLLALFAFRRGGAGMALLVLCFVLPVRAQESRDMPSQGTHVQGTPWRRPDQMAHARMEQGTEAYRKGDFARAASAYEGLNSADAHYNRGNALARQGRYEDAIDAYDRALRMNPGMADALANKRAVEAAMKRKPPPGQQDGRGKPDQPRKSQGGQQGQPSGDSTPQRAAQPAVGQQPREPSSGDKAPGAEPKARPPVQPDTPADAKAQQAADAAQRARMQQALSKAKQGKQQEEQGQVQARTETPAERERRLANEAWLQRVPDDPGGLLRAKFRLEYERRQREGGQ